MSCALTLGVVLLCAYLPFYFNGAPLTGKWCSPTFGASKLWTWVWRHFWGLPLSESRWDAADFADASKRYIFGSHPHGVMSMHHMGTMCAMTAPALFCCRAHVTPATFTRGRSAARE
eukprot:3365714-Prymnesium_polylepis.1